ITNPKSYILFGAVLPQFVNRGAGHVAGQMLVLALVSVLIGAVCDCGWGVAASAVRNWFASSARRVGLGGGGGGPGMSRAGVSGAGGLDRIGVGVTVAITGRND